MYSEIQGTDKDKRGNTDLCTQGREGEQGPGETNQSAADNHSGGDVQRGGRVMCVMQDKVRIDLTQKEGTETGNKITQILNHDMLGICLLFMSSMNQIKCYFHRLLLRLLYSNVYFFLPCPHKNSSLSALSEGFWVVLGIFGSNTTFVFTVAYT